MSRGLTRLALAALFLLAPTTGIAGMNSKEPPKTAVYVRSEKLQAGYLRAYCWIYPASSDNDPNAVVQGCGDNKTDYPRVDRVRAGRRVQIRIDYPEKPDGTIIKAYGQADGPGKGRVVDHELNPVLDSSGAVSGWKLVFTVSPDRHYYLQAGAFWDWTAPDGYTYTDDAIWHFHLKTR